MNRRIAAVGPASPDVVWDRYIRPENWSGWSPQIRSVDSPDSPVRAGSRGRVHGPLGVVVDFEVLEVDLEKRCWEWRVTLPGDVRLTLGHAVEPRGSGTRTTLDISGPAPIVLGYAPVAYVALTRLVR